MTSASVSASVSATAEELPGCDTLGRGDVFVAAFAWSTMIITGTGGTGACAMRARCVGRRWEGQQGRRLTHSPWPRLSLALHSHA